MENYGEHFHMNIKMIDAKERFLNRLKGISDPEEKRKIIGNEFVAVLMKNLTNSKVQILSSRYYLSRCYRISIGKWHFCGY